MTNRSISVHIAQTQQSNLSFVLSFRYKLFFLKFSSIVSSRCPTRVFFGHVQTRSSYFTPHLMDRPAKPVFKTRRLPYPIFSAASNWPPAIIKHPPLVSRDVCVVEFRHDDVDSFTFQPCCKSPEWVSERKISREPCRGGHCWSSCRHALWVVNI